VLSKRAIDMNTFVKKINKREKYTKKGSEHFMKSLYR